MQLLIASLMVAFTVLVHLLGISALVAMFQLHSRMGEKGRVFRNVAAILVSAFGLFALHTVEIWAYAALYYSLHALPSFEEALYFSTSTYSTIGYGDIILPRAWRILGAIEGANGIILLGWSTAFFISIVDQIRKLERSIETT